MRAEFKPYLGTLKFEQGCSLQNKLLSLKDTHHTFLVAPTTWSWKKNKSTSLFIICHSCFSLSVKSFFHQGGYWHQQPMCIKPVYVFKPNTSSWGFTQACYKYQNCAFHTFQGESACHDRTAWLSDYMPSHAYLDQGWYILPQYKVAHPFRVTISLRVTSPFGVAPLFRVAPLFKVAPLFEVAPPSRVAPLFRVTHRSEFLLHSELLFQRPGFTRNTWATCNASKLDQNCNL